MCAQVLNTLLYLITNLINHELKANETRNAICVKVRLKLSRSYIHLYLYLFVIIYNTRFIFRINKGREVPRTKKTDSFWKAAIQLKQVPDAPAVGHTSRFPYA